MGREMGQNGKMVDEAATQEEYVNSFRRGSFGMALGKQYSNVDDEKR